VHPCVRLARRLLARVELSLQRKKKGFDRVAKGHEVEAACEQVRARLFIRAETLEFAGNTLGLPLTFLPRIENPSLSAFPYCIEFGAFAGPRGRSSGGHYTVRSLKLLSGGKLLGFQSFFAGKPFSEQF
jgi:hypothetical protein